jgi:sulfonate transport system substrate-binding protein
MLDGPVNSPRMSAHRAVRPVRQAKPCAVGRLTPTIRRRQQHACRENAMHLKIGWASVLILLMSAGFARAEPVTLRFAWVAPVSDWASLWLQKKDLARHYGQSYVVEPTRFRGTPPMITAIANNELEIGALAYSTLPIAIENAGMDDIRVIADNFRDGVAGYFSNDFEVRADSAIHKVGDLKGKVILTNAAGSAVDVAMRAMLHKHGLEINRDYTTIEAPFPAMRAMLAEKKVDLIPAILPFVYDPELQKIARPLFTSKDALGISQFIMLTARKPFIDAHRGALVDFLEDTLRIVHWYLDPKNHAAAAAIAAELTKQPADHLDWVFTKRDYFRDPELLPDLDALQRNVDMTQELGFVHAHVDIKTHSDLSLVEEAAKRLK